MLGGYQILDLTNINLELGADAVDITDSGVLKQLLNLREYIEKGYDFSRPLNNQLKPFQVRYRDKKADEEITATLWASLLVIDSGFIISASIPNYANLEIFVSFSEETDDDGNNYWAIDSAQVKYNLIASSGTKLYRHELSCMFTYDGDAYVISGTLISTNNAQLDFNEGFELSDVVSSVFGIRIESVYYPVIDVINLESDSSALYVTLLYYNNTNVIKFDEEVQPTTFTDTVTEL